MNDPINGLYLIRTWDVGITRKVPRKEKVVVVVASSRNHFLRKASGVFLGSDREEYDLENSAIGE